MAIVLMRKGELMTDTERERINAICKVAGVSDIDDLSDGFHTFRQLYYQRMMLFAVIVKQNKDRTWKSLRHEDGELCFGGGWFIVGIDTPEGSYTYHYENNYYSLFDCEELERGKHWDGHTEKDVTRLMSLEPEIKTDGDTISRQAAISLAGDLQIHGDEYHMYNQGINNYCAEIMGLPSTQSERKKGKWIHGREIARQYLCNELVNIEYENYHCSECGHTVKNIRWNVDGELVDRYCSVCGAEMKGQEKTNEQRNKTGDCSGRCVQKTR